MGFLIVYCCFARYGSRNSKNSINLKFSIFNNFDGDEENSGEDNDLIVLLEEGAKNNAFKPVSFNNETCRIPALNFDGVARLLPKKECKVKKNVGYLQNHTWYLSERAKSDYVDLKCMYRIVYRVNDFKTRLSEFKLLENGQTVMDDVIEVHCNQTAPKFHFSSLYPQIISKLEEEQNNNENLHKPDANQCTPLNVIVMSYDSVSRVSWLKLLKKTHKFATETMKFDVLNGYNIVGDGTPAGKLYFVLKWEVLDSFK